MKYVPLNKVNFRPVTTGSLYAKLVQPVREFAEFVGKPLAVCGIQEGEVNASSLVVVSRLDAMEIQRHVPASLLGLCSGSNLVTGQPFYQAVAGAVM